MAREQGGDKAAVPVAAGGVARGSREPLMPVPLLRGPAASESLITVLVAFGANLLIAVAKSAAAVVTGSASLTAEAAHSWADCGNEIFLLIANRRARRPPDRAHPFGHGREAYVWSLFAALGVFVAGGAVSVTRGIQELIHPEPEIAVGTGQQIFLQPFLVFFEGCGGLLLERRQLLLHLRRAIEQRIQAFTDEADRALHLIDRGLSMNFRRMLQVRLRLRNNGRNSFHPFP